MKSFQVTDFNAPLQEVDSPTPQPQATQVLIKVKAAGVCHSDLHIWEGGYDLGHGRKPMSLKDRGVSLPRTMGHETVGEVLAFGPDVKASDKGDLKIGDVALVYPWLGCGKCDVCLAGEENMCLKPASLGVYCDGGYADHMTVPHPRYLLNLKGLDPVTAAPYACSGVTTFARSSGRLRNQAATSRMPSRRSMATGPLSSRPRRNTRSMAVRDILRLSRSCRRRTTARTWPWRIRYLSGWAASSGSW